MHPIGVIACEGDGLMRAKHRRMTFVLIGLGLLAAAVAMVLTALDDNLAFFHSPTDILEKKPGPDQRLRLGGLVLTGSVNKREEGKSVEFVVTDNSANVTVFYTGILPDLFREGQGVVVEGKVDANGTFQASEVLAKHDENYMPAEVADALKKQGHWKEQPKGSQP